MFLKVLMVKSGGEGTQKSGIFRIKLMLSEDIPKSASKGKSTVKSVRDAFFNNFLFIMCYALISNY